jgi:uncharacterized repeat protein (TIGR01451 family)
VSFTAGADISASFTVPLTTASQGFHTLYVRTRDAQRRWSLTSQQSFFTAVLAPANQALTAAEYFIDQEPGLGQGTPIGLPQAGQASPTVSFNVGLSTVSTGFHTLYLRARDAQGAWSLTQSQAFYVLSLPPAGQALARAEYFIDQDPGPGNGIAVTLPANQAAVTLAFNVPLTNVATGAHTLYLRVADKGKAWSLPQQHAFLVKPGGGLATITAFEYYFTGTGANASYTSATLRYAVPTPAASVSLNFAADLSQLPGNADYDMRVWAVSSEGLRSLVQTKRVRACNNLPVKAGFDFIALGTQVSFIDSSRNATRYRWSFGDGKTDTVSNPSHTYALGGTYAVRLITSSFCNSDTLTKKITVLDLQSVYPAKGGNTGSVTVTLLGSGFTVGTEVKLLQAGKELIGSNTVVIDDKTIQSTFSLYSQPVGVWDLQVSAGTNGKLLRNAFTIEAGLATNLKVAIVGRDVARIGTAQRFTVSVNNISNIDAKGVFLWIAVPPGTIISPVGFELATPKDNGLLANNHSLTFTTDSLFNSPTKAEVFGLILRAVPSAGTTRLEFDLTFKASGTIHVWTSDPTFGSPLRPEVSVCHKALSGLSKVAYELGKVFIPPVACGDAIFNAGTELYNFSDKVLNDTSNEWKNISIRYEIRGYKGDVDPVGKIESYTGVMLNKYVVPVLPIVGETLWNCLGYTRLADKVGFTAWSNDFLTVLGQNLAAAKDPRRLVSRVEGLGRGTIVWKIFKPGVEITKDFKDYAEYGINAYETGWDAAECVAWLRKGNLAQKLIQVVASFDPNEKVGPRGETTANFVQGKDQFEYKIYFENLRTATAPAQQVLVVDSLDKKTLALPTLQLRSFGFGSKVSRQIPAGLAAYSTTLDLRPGRNLLVRVDAKVDTAAGVLKWRFISLVPSSLETPNDPLAGFLPPNAAAPEGEGFISFSVQPRQGLGTGVQIKNKAAIFFDSNAPIVTNTFVNTLDRTSPVSRVTSVSTTPPTGTFTVSWVGSDLHSGIQGYDIFYTVNGHRPKLWLTNTIATSAAFTGLRDSVYCFYSVAHDLAGNVEAAPTTPTVCRQVVLSQQPAALAAPQGFTLYPNPTPGLFTVEAYALKPEQTSLRIEDVIGHVVYSDGLRLQAGTQRQALDISRLAPGLYFVKINISGKTVVRKLLKN